jgi:diguanylate cyclase (GGDEF)-like protein/PAS domain S-box-containing protein
LERGKVVSWASDNTPLSIAGTHDDISERKRIEHLFFVEKNRLEATLMSVGDGVITTDMHGKVVMLNKIAERLTGWTIDEAKGEDFGDVFQTMDANTGDHGDNPVKRVLESGLAVELWDDSILVAKDGTEHFINDSASPIKDEQGSMNGVVLVFRDSSHKRTERETILRLGFVDQLTQLQNRRAYDLELEQMFQADLFPIAFILADLDGLKLANDAFSHDTGDLLLQRVADVLSEVADKSDLVARIGGDEFLILMHQTTQELAEARIQIIIGKLREQKVGHMTISLSTRMAMLQSGDMDPA